MGQPLGSKSSLLDVIDHVSNLIGELSGNVLGKDQRSMVQTRLQKRMLDLGSLSPDEYLEHIRRNKSSETDYLISLLTTHHTFFFREFIHFEILAQKLPSIIADVKQRGERKIRVWSAACSRGQEVYSLAMFLKLQLKSYPEMDFEIIGTDIDPESVKYGENGVYLYKEVKSIPQIYISGNWQKGTGDISHFAKVKKDIKSKVKFQTFNLIESSYSSFGVFDIVFCRNVFIYFNPETVSDVVNKIRTCLTQKGLLITGLSESLNSLSIDKVSFGPSVYSFYVDEQVKSAEAAPAKSHLGREAATAKLSVVPKEEASKTIKMLLVDDSKSVLKVLARIFSTDPGFEVVGTAENGLEAQEFLRNNQVDAMTLDIHMPEMDGVEYLKKNYKKNHPRVVVVSSASREDTRYAQQVLENGASDFVEKPSLQNMQERADEIKMKVKMSLMTPQVDKGKPQDFIKRDFIISNCENKARVLFCPIGRLSHVEAIIEDLEGDQPPVFLFFEGNENSLGLVQERLRLRSKVVIYETGMDISPNVTYICDFSIHYKAIFSKGRFAKRSLGLLGLATDKLKAVISSENDVQLLLEDNGVGHGGLEDIASDCFPSTSFSHVGTEYLAKD
jgi:chemotaxis protein methyltransferase CheR